jgi:hypothetical protein
LLIIHSAILKAMKEKLPDPSINYSDYQDNVPLIEPLNEVRSRGVFLLNTIICTAVFTGKQPQAFWRGTRQGPNRLEGKLSRATQQWCHRGAVSKPPGGMQDLV